MSLQIILLTFFIIFKIENSNATMTGQSCIKTDVTKLCPNDISLCIVDLKFDGSHVTICEFGEGLESQFEGYDSLYGKGAAWSMIWKSLSKFQLPMWYIDKRRKKNSNRSLNTFMSLGGRCEASLELLQQDTLFKHHDEKKESLNNTISGIVALRSLGISPSHLMAFKQKYPHIILLGYGTNYFVRSKHRTHNLFNDPDVAHYRPECAIHTKKYNPQLAENIIKNLKTNTVVIKPLNAARGNGIIIASANELDEILQQIVISKNTLKKSALFCQKDTAYKYWLRDKNSKFIIEAYAPSKKIFVDGKAYDPTMRVIFLASCLHEKITIDFLDAYWKLPTHALDDPVPLTEKHKSSIKDNALNAVRVDATDFVMVKALLSKALPDVYKKMLCTYNTNGL